MIVFGGPLKAHCLVEPCAVYMKRGVVGLAGLGKKARAPRTQENQGQHDRTSMTVHFYEGLMASNMFPTPEPYT